MKTPKTPTLATGPQSVVDAVLAALRHGCPKGEQALLLTALVAAADLKKELEG